MDEKQLNTNTFSPWSANNPIGKFSWQLFTKMLQNEPFLHSVLLKVQEIGGKFLGNSSKIDEIWKIYMNSKISIVLSVLAFCYFVHVIKTGTTLIKYIVFIFLAIYFFLGGETYGENQWSISIHFLYLLMCKNNPLSYFYKHCYETFCKSKILLLVKTPITTHRSCSVSSLQKHHNFISGLIWIER